MEPLTAKVIAILSLGLGSFIAGMLPATFSARARQRHPLLLSSLLCFGAGVLLATSLVHMLPEAREKLPMYSELVLCLGFFLVYLVDEIVHFFYGASGDSHSHVENYGTTERTGLLSSNRLASGSKCKPCFVYVIPLRRYKDTAAPNVVQGNEIAGKSWPNLAHPSTSVEDGEMAVRETCCGDTGNPRMCHVSHTPPCNKSASGLIGLLCALFVHSVLEGLAIGLEETSTKVLLLLGAVSAHKYVVGFCLGVELCSSMAGRLCAQIVCVLVFSAGSAVGVAIGAAMDASSTLRQAGQAVPLMQALAAGTLLYVTVSEVLPRERARWHNARRGAGAAQLLAVVIGFGLMYLTTVYLDHDD